MRTKIGLKCDRNKTEIKAKEAETCCRLLQFKRWNRKKKLWTKSAAKFGFQVSAWGSNCIGAYFWPLLTSGLILILLCHSRKLIWYQCSWKQLTWSHNSPNACNSSNSYTGQCNWLRANTQLNTTKCHLFAFSNVGPADTRYMIHDMAIFPLRNWSNIKTWHPYLHNQRIWMVGRLWVLSFEQKVCQVAISDNKSLWMFDKSPRSHLTNTQHIAVRLSSKLIIVKNHVFFAFLRCFIVMTIKYKIGTDLCCCSQAVPQITLLVDSNSL